MNKITLATSSGSSEILIQEDGLSAVSDWIKEKYPESKVMVITDTNIGDLYKEKIGEIFPDAQILAVQAGEGTKKLESVKQLAEELLNENMHRTDILIGFGGGMVTDLVGFVASVYMRGMVYIAVPTSLLCMVDAAIGGKTAINLEAKNILGTFYPAELVLIDPAFLNGLPERQFRSGIAEIIKYAATLDSSIADELLEDELDIETILQKSIQAKADIVSQDLNEKGIRKVLNFGHTFGHAIEQMSDYDLTHGEAISIGMVLANKVAQNLGKQEKETDNQMRKLFEKFKLPSEIPSRINIEDLVSLMKKDKKVYGDKITYIIAPEMGKYEMLELSAEELVDLAK
ncbi:3-dehydroquinate synthase [Patescibacteria group bacterium]|nr:3-dehydroquinate synthase [Patescibacteria group bacterium]MBU1682505.1 3-dehydroquinate synthase [Patescibacteria group bacterium]